MSEGVEREAGAGGAEGASWGPDPGRFGREADSGGGVPSGPPRPGAEARRPEPVAASGGGVRRRFAHPSEAEFARLLDFYGVRWEYEPRTFPLAHDEDGRVTLCFTPDFYLPDQDLYVELTTMSPRLVHRKNRKLRKLRERYPDVRIKLFYLRDLRALMLKYGLTPTAGPLEPNE